MKDTTNIPEILGGPGDESPPPKEGTACWQIRFPNITEQRSLCSVLYRLTINTANTLVQISVALQAAVSRIYRAATSRDKISWPVLKELVLWVPPLPCLDYMVIAHIVDKMTDKK